MSYKLKKITTIKPTCQQYSKRLDILTKQNQIFIKNDYF